MQHSVSGRNYVCAPFITIHKIRIFNRLLISLTIFNQFWVKNYQIKTYKIFNFSHKISQKRHFVAKKRQFSSSVSRKRPSGETT